jgi:ribonuclease Z
MIMTTSRISRVLVTFASLLFAALALELWVAPQQAAHRLGLEALRPSGLAVLRADLGGLFAGMSLLCGVAAWTRGRSWCIAAASMLAAIALGRATGWIGNRAIGNDIFELAIELVIVVALLGLARRASTAEVATPESGEPSGRMGRPALIAGAVLVLLVAGAATLLSANVQQEIFNLAAKQRASTTNSALLADDALRVAICGSSAPLPSPSRAKACVAVFAGGRFYIVDVGPESVENLVLWGIPLSKIGGVLLTHFHSDHLGDLGELNLQSWAAGRPAPLDVYGGPGVERVVQGFNDAYRLDQGYRTEHHTDRVMPPATWPMVPQAIALEGPETPAKDRTGLVFERDGLRVTAIEVDHSPISPAYAYRFDYKGRSALITGDLKYHPPLIKAARGVDLMVSEAISTSMTRALGKGASDGGRTSAAAIMHDIEDYHIEPEQAAQIANDANAKLLVFYHLLPAPDGMLARRLFAQGIDEARRGDWEIADDGSLYTLPLGASDVRIGRVR